MTKIPIVLIRWQETYACNECKKILPPNKDKFSEELIEDCPEHPKHPYHLVPVYNDVADAFFLGFGVEHGNTVAIVMDKNGLIVLEHTSNIRFPDGNLSSM